MRKVTIFFVYLLSFFIALFLFGCKNGDSVTQFQSTTLSARPIATAGGSPIVLDSMTDGDFNYFFVHAGRIEDLYISTLAMVNYTGVETNFVKTTSSSQSIISTLTESVSTSIMLSNTTGHKVGIEVGIKQLLSPTTLLEVKGSYEWTTEFTKTNTSMRSTESTLTTAKEYSDSQTISYKFGNNTHPIGYYRYAVYGVADLYFIIKTTRNNQTLISWSTNVLARPDEYFIRSEYSEKNDFNNLPETDITILQDFYKSFPIPVDTSYQSGDTVNYHGGHGTEESPYKVKTKVHFINMVERQTGYFELVDDIDLGEWSTYGIKSWTKNSFNAPDSFTGTLDGKNKTVKYTIRIGGTTLASWAVGLFPSTNGATIKNLNIEADLSTYDPQDRNKKWDISNDDRAVDAMAGGLVGFARNTLIDKVNVTGKVRYNSDGGDGDTCVGGIVGYATGSTITNSKSSATVYARGFWVNVGGVIGVAHASTTSNLQFNGNVSGNKDWIFGGFWKESIIAKSGLEVLPNP